MIKKLILSCLLLSCIYAQTAVAPAAGDGSESNPYQIATLSNLYWISADSLNWDKHYIQTADINMSECQNWKDSVWTGWEDNYEYYYGWIPIGNPFTGTFDGQFHTIDSLYISFSDLETKRNIGLFSSVKHAEISNIGLRNTYILIAGGINIGSLIGQCDSSSIENCYCETAIQGMEYVGGLIGLAKNSNIKRCFVKNYDYSGEWSGGVRSTNIACGISGYTENSKITNCYNGAYVCGSNYANPITAQDTLSEISYCYSKQVASTGSSIFGIPGSTSFCLGFYDYVQGNRYFQSSYRIIEEMKNPNLYLDAGWDFIIETENGTDDIWDIDRTGVINNGYPFLHWEHPETTYFTSIEENQIPENFYLNQNYPNPFNPTTTISYQLPAVSDVQMIIFDLSGRKVKQWSFQNQSMGTYEITWNAKDRLGEPVPSGVYLYCLITGDFVESKKMVLLK